MRRVIAIELAMMTITASALADCPDQGFETRLRDNRSQEQRQLSFWLNGKRINATAPDGENWKEDHCLGGELVKVGNGTSVDPRRVVGAWAVIGTNGRRVEYTYDGDAGRPYRWRVYRDEDAGGLCWQERPADGSAVVATGPDSIPIPEPCP
ncbi:MAG: hypothetical protein WBG92_12810 [Thiohalocapsa sp.]